jgi:hypothetical protein
MALPSSPPLKLSEVVAEFGDTPPKSMSEYYGLAGLPVLGSLLSLSDFLGIDTSPPPSNYTWVGIVDIKPEVAPANSARHGYSADQYGVLNSKQNYNDFRLLITDSSVTSPSFDAIGTAGIVINEPIANGYSTLDPSVDARDVDRVEYRVYGGSATTASGTLSGSVVAGGKYGSAWVYRAFGPATGPLSGVGDLADLFKYAADRNANLELKTIIP